MNKALSFALDIALLVLFLLLGVTGLIIFPGLLQVFGGTMGTLPKFYLYEVHHWIGLILVVLISLHLDLHWKWIKAMTKGIRKNTKKTTMKKPIINYGIDLGLIITFTVMFITGIIKFRGFTAWTRLDPRVIPMYEISLLHDHVGLLALLFSILHILLHLRWIASTAQAMAQRLKTSLFTHWKKLLSVFLLLSVFIGSILIVFNPMTSSTTITNPKHDHSITIEGVGTFSYPSQHIPTIRTDIFKNSSYSIYAILKYLHDHGSITMESHFDETMDTYVIDSINGIQNWWYEAYYDGGWPENNVFRIDHYPFKEKMTIRLFTTTQNYLNAIYSVFQGEIQREQISNTTHILPKVIIQTKTGTLEFFNVEVSPHNKRADQFQDNVITALDVIMSLGDQGLITYSLNWYDSIGSAEVVRSYFVDSINNDATFLRCGFVYEAGSYDFQGFTGNHIHIPADSRVLHAPEYVFWFWTCL